MESYDFDEQPLGFEELPDWLQEEARAKQIDRASKDQRWYFEMRKELAYTFLAGCTAAFGLLGWPMAIIPALLTGTGAAYGVHREWNAFRFCGLFTATLTFPMALQQVATGGTADVVTPLIMVMPPIVGLVLGFVLARERMK